MARFSLPRDLLPGAAKLPSIGPDVTDPKPPPPSVLPKPLVPEASPAKGDAPPPPPNVNFGASAGLLFEEIGGEAKEVKDGAPADPKGLIPGPPKEAKGEEELVASLLKPEAEKALGDVEGCFFSADFWVSASAGFWR